MKPCKLPINPALNELFINLINLFSISPFTSLILVASLNLDTISSTLRVPQKNS